ncbi:UPF0073 inner membrane protein YqfA [Seminavis robusta]|uniref:UPF0073 inner membrane protein YqfA n=1 Tax=Seminavis robusta TaxID=568900 RepID=A0A9N8HFE7_9STRA|nr:UPF0073 inner membrane protein YqfA [Seminavis robusta]|eukprot:Sro521_g159280.1 UPF0073 inner membrane protein YqfA (555) ;mRNA; f:16932-18761
MASTTVAGRIKKNDGDDSSMSNNDNSSEPNTPLLDGAGFRRNSSIHRSLPLSTRLIGSLAGGMYCRDCRRPDHGDELVATSPTSSSLLQDLDDAQGNNGLSFHDYNMQEVARQSSVVSPLVLAPMLQPLEPGKMATVENIIAEYIATCRFYGCQDRVNAGVLTTLRFSLPSLRVSGDFHDADMLALAEIMLRHGNGPLRFIKRLDFTRSSKEGKLHGQRGFRSHGALTLSKILQQSEYIQEVRMEGNRLGPYGASAIFLACSRNRTVRRLGMRKCIIGERGGLAFAELLQRDCQDGQDSHLGLVDVDLSVNRIGFRGSLAIERAMMERTDKGRDSIFVDIFGNLVLQEILNGCTHGLGIILAIVGAVLLMKRVQDMSNRHFFSCAIYSVSLLVLYTSSTLYHSFFALQQTRYIFEVLDKCAIYILIAGSYTPFITITMVDHFHLLVGMLAFIWVLTLIGIYVEYAHPTWKRKQIFSLSMYLGIGWVAVIAPKEVVDSVATGATNLIVLGGVGYTTGIPFFLRDNFLDHSIWHLFVLTASIFHWAAVYYYICFME